MKNLTLRIDEKVLAEARKLAALEGTTVAKLVREFLTALVEEQEADAAAERARHALVEPAKRSKADFSDRRRNREELYAERRPRFRRDEPRQGGFAEAAPHENREMKETILANGPTLEEMTTDTGAPPVPGHDEWFRRQVRLALDDDKSGKADYKDFDEVAAEFGFNAR